jgi:hypothetical protein
MTQAASRWSLTGGDQVDEVVLGQVFSKLMGFPLSVPIHRSAPYPHITGTKNRPFVAAVQRQPHPIKMNNNTNYYKFN